MNINKYIRFVIFILMAFLLRHEILMAQFSLNTQVRPRAEYRQGFRIPADTSDNAAFFVSQRTRLSLAYQNDKISLYVAPQDVRVWGDEYQLAKEARLGLHEAYGILHIDTVWSFKVGRQEIVYNDHRILGNVEWAQQARSHDALLLRYINSGYKAALGASFNQNSERLFLTDYVPQNYKVMLHAYAQKKWNNHTVDALIVSDAFEENSTSHNLKWRHTLGLNAQQKLKQLMFDETFFWQTGTTQNDVNIAAWLMVAKATYQLPKLKLVLGAEIVSGDNPDDADKFQAFNTLYATNHKFYGFMDYWLNIPVDTKGGGLQDFYLQATFSPLDKLSIQLNLHQFMLANNVYNPFSTAETLNKNLGNEVDVVLIHTIHPSVNLKFGSSVYLPKASTKAIKGGSDEQISGWVWAMLNFNTTVFQSIKKEN